MPKLPCNINSPTRFSSTSAILKDLRFLVATLNSDYYAFLSDSDAPKLFMTSEHSACEDFVNAFDG